MVKRRFGGIEYMHNHLVDVDRKGRMTIPKINHMIVYQNRNGPEADYFIGTPHTYIGEFPAIVLFDPTAVEESDIFNRPEVLPCDLETIKIRSPQNRILLPKHFKQFIRLEDQAIISGHGSQLRIWRPEVYRAYSDATPIDWVLWFNASAGTI
ncbi:division/cell wall cluster transcriptional repressor MraZ [Candidatus Woesearchaeota archaeon]|nr:division/cell wall cluster transcriptional repressor MraZ [Candidatus Woesearchaeota archaeon]